HGGESADTHGGDSRLGTASDHHIGVATRDDLECVAHRVSARSAGGAGGLVRALCVVANTDMAGGQVNDGGRNKKRRYLPWAAMDEVGMLAFDDIESANA